MKSLKDYMEKSLKSQNTITEPQDCSKLSAQGVYDYLSSVLNANCGLLHKRENYYCGITQENIEDNLNRHEVDGYAACALTKNQETAAAVEDMMHDAGYDTGDRAGGNGGNEGSVVVYVCHKEAGFKR